MFLFGFTSIYSRLLRMFIFVYRLVGDAKPGMVMVRQAGNI